MSVTTRQNILDYISKCNKYQIKFKRILIGCNSIMGCLNEINNLCLSSGYKNNSGSNQYQRLYNNNMIKQYIKQINNIVLSTQYYDNIDDNANNNIIDNLNLISKKLSELFVISIKENDTTNAKTDSRIFNFEDLHSGIKTNVFDQLNDIINMDTSIEILDSEYATIDGIKVKFDETNLSIGNHTITHCDIAEYKSELDNTNLKLLSDIDIEPTGKWINLTTDSSGTNYIKFSNNLDEFDIDLEDVQHIYFAGGEPLINPTHWKVLDNIKNPHNVSLQYNSNLAVVKNIDKYWPKFKKVSVNASMDAVGQLGEYLRYGTKWDKWVQNIEYASNFADLKLNPTISVLNIFHLKEIEEWSNYPIDYNILTDPQHLCVSVLPKKLKNKIEYIPDNAHLKQLLNTDDSWLFPHTMSFILLQDKLKNTNIWDSLPFNEYAIQEFMKEGL